MNDYKKLSHMVTALFISILFILSASLPAASTGTNDGAGDGTAPTQENGEGDGESSHDPPEQEHAAYAYLYNFENDAVLYEKGDLNLPVYPTSTVKIMTGVAAIEALGDDRQREITVTEEMLDLVAGNSLGLEAGERVTAEQMLYGTIANSANDAAIVLAYMVSGSVESFVSLMNDKAHELGMNSTVYTNPTGMHDDAMYTTTADTVKLAAHAYGLPYYMEIASTEKYVMQSLTSESEYRTVRNRNCLISKFYRSDYYYERALGMNAGYTLQGGYSGVFVARSDDGKLTYLCVIMNAEATDDPNGGDDNVLNNYAGAIELFDWAFDNYSYREVLSDKQVLAELPVTLSATVDYVTLVPAGGITVYLQNDVDPDVDIKTVISTEETLAAPITKGQVAGNVRVVYGDRELGRVDLITTADVARSEFLYSVDRIKQFTTGSFFIATAISAVLLTIAYVLFKARLRVKRLRRGNPGGFRK